MPTTSQPYHRFDKEYYSTEGYENYEQWHEQSAKENVITPLLKLIGTKSRSFLDVGCGMGGSVLTLRKSGHEARGTEVSPHCLATSPAKEWMSFGPAYALPFENNSFDVVICCDIFQYLTLSQAEKSIEEFCRVAKEYVSLWVFDPDTYSWSQIDNPDDVRIEDTKHLTKGDYAAYFARHGFEPAHMISDFSEESGVPEWHLLFKRKNA